MALLDDHSAAFILRVWCEPTRDAPSHLAWRGTIEHVPSGRRAHFLDTEAITAFIGPYIDALLRGTEPPAAH